MTGIVMSDNALMIERMQGILAQIPPGRVLSYGRLAELAGFPGQARQAARLLRQLPDPDLPWHRVLSADGHSRIPAPDTRSEQFQRLWDEDVPMRSADQVDMTWAIWDPGSEHDSP